MEAFVDVHIPIPLHAVLIKGDRGERERERDRQTDRERQRERGGKVEKGDNKTVSHF